MQLVGSVVSARIYICRGGARLVLDVGRGGIRGSVDSPCRDGADVQYMQYLSKSRITSPQTRKKLI